ncbi:uncharacterized protein BO66DRAFT_47572 [Aspergillus aculeatinus CBS 121060]|uniref:Uncharacterized protein n=1 Tax=Aspergillus aculeatinus CBS 121060 TaxID=1448322 RepID=A0ACD1HE33_9EURO|nr:hypothetical protein BO66DRAFT_47572 [Aspergillus aculeatinus CBS 121060]RAH71732.1 hypothetical protein BO66DRAFT_47572 [Aspergillus aculeatinus CBS 121060]
MHHNPSRIDPSALFTSWFLESRSFRSSLPGQSFHPIARSCFPHRSLLLLLYMHPPYPTRPSLTSTERHASNPIFLEPPSVVTCASFRSRPISTTAVPLTPIVCSGSIHHSKTGNRSELFALSLNSFPTAIAVKLRPYGSPQEEDVGLPVLPMHFAEQAGASRKARTNNRSATNSTILHSKISPL